MGSIQVYDEQRLKRLLLNVCYDRLQFSSYGEPKLPAVVATEFDVLGDIENLEKVFKDFLQYCQELFAHLPDEQLYDWLRDYSAIPKDENRQVAHLLIDELADLEVDLGKRLVRTLVSLTLSRSNIVWPVLMSRLSDTEGLQKARLLDAIGAIAAQRPGLLCLNLDT